MIEEPDPFAPPGESEPSSDDPFAPAGPPDLGGRGAPDVTPTVLGPLVQRDPDAPLDESGEYRVTGAASFDDVLRRARRQGFLAGAAAGALAGAIVTVALAVATSRPNATATRTVIAEAPEPANAVSADVAAPPRGPPGRGIPAASGARPGESAAAPLAPAAAEAGAVDPAASPEEDDLAARAPSADAGSAAAAGEEVDAAAEAAVGEPPPSGDDSPGAEPTESTDSPGSPGEEAGAAPAAGAGTAAARPPDERAATAALGAKRDDLDACVAETPGENAAARGRVFRLLVDVEPSGRVSDARTDDAEIGGTPLGLCLVRLARELSFAPFDGEPVRLGVRVRNEDPE